MVIRANTDTSITWSQNAVEAQAKTTQSISLYIAEASPGRWYTTSYGAPMIDRRQPSLPPLCFQPLSWDAKSIAKVIEQVIPLTHCGPNRGMGAFRTQAE